MTKSEREEREFKSLFADEKYSKQTWKRLMASALEGNGRPLPTMIDPKTGEETFNSKVDRMAYDNVKARLLAENLDREPMQAELIVEVNVLRSRFADNMFNVLLDRTAGKVKEEVNISSSQFEELSDEELEVLAAHRLNKKKE